MRAAVVVTVVAALAVVSCTSNAATSGASGVTATSPAPVSSGTSASPAAHQTYPDWPTYHGDAARTGVSASMPQAAGTPVLAKSIKLDGAVYASPIVAGGNTVVATENDTVYAFGPTNATVWRTHLGAPSPAGERPCGDIDPLGITGTPVYSKATGAHGVVYAAIEIANPPRHRLVALDATTGAVLWRVDLDLPGTDAAAMQERGALTIAGGRVWVPFGGLAGDCGAYKGRLVGVPLSGTGAPISYTVPTTREAGIWTPPGPTVNANHLYVAVGNGESGVGDPYDFSDSILEVSAANAHLLDSYSPSTWPTDNDADLDLGSQGPAIVSGKWVYADGKSGTAYVLALGHLGGIGGEVSQGTVCKSFGGTAVMGDVVYVPCTDGVRAVQIDSTGHLHVLWHAASSTAGSPVVGGGLVWALDSSGGALHGLNPTTGASVEQMTVGATNRFATPALSGNRVLVGTLTGLAVVTTS